MLLRPLGHATAGKLTDHPGLAQIAVAGEKAVQQCRAILGQHAAARVHGDGWRLEGATLAVTVEPCTMCAGALVMAKVARVVFGAWEPKTGAVGSLWDVVRDRRLTHRPQVRGGVLAEDCAALLDGFFARHRDLG